MCLKKNCHQFWYYWGESVEPLGGNKTQCMEFWCLGCGFEGNAKIKAVSSRGLKPTMAELRE